MYFFLFPLIFSQVLSLSLHRHKHKKLAHHSLYDVRDKELETYISINENSWENERFSLYTAEIESPQQDAAQKGLLFSKKFSQIKEKMVSEKMRISLGKKKKVLYFI